MGNKRDELEEEDSEGGVHGDCGGGTNREEEDDAKSDTDGAGEDAICGGRTTDAACELPLEWLFLVAVGALAGFLAAEAAGMDDVADMSVCFLFAPFCARMLVLALGGVT